MRRNTETASQHFLKSPYIAEQLLKKVPLSKSDVVYDIGAGSGVITSVLSYKVAKVVAVEPDSRVAATLKKNSTQYGPAELQIVEKFVEAVAFPETPYKIVANIPFHISAEIVKRFFNSKSAPTAAYLIVQRQFGQKLVSSESGRFTSQLGMMLGAEYAIKILGSLKKTDYTPPPAVDTVFIEIKKRKYSLVEPALLDAYRLFTEKCFADQKFLSRQPLHVIGATPGLSPSRLSLSQWLILFHASRAK